MVVAVYLDESKPDDGRMGVMAIAGIVLDLQGVESFESRWAALLSERSLAEWHQTDFERRTPEYDWPNEERYAFQGKLIDIIKETMIFGWAAVLDLDAAAKFSRSWSALFQQMGLGDDWQKQAPRLSGEYLICALGCLGTIGTYLRMMGHTEPAVFVLDAITDPSKGKGDIKRMFDTIISPNRALRTEFMIGGVDWADSKETLPLQGADLFVYEMAKEVARRHGHNKRDQRVSASKLLEIADGKVGYRYYDDDLLGEMGRFQAGRFLADNFPGATVR